MEIVWGTSKEPDLNRLLARWAAAHIWGGGNQQFGECRTMGVVLGGDLIAVMVFHNWNPESGVIEISGAGTSKRWLTRTTLRRMFAYPFDDVGCQMVVMRVSERNEPLARMLKVYGFKSHRIPRLRGRSEDEIVFTLTDDDWRANKFMRP